MFFSKHNHSRFLYHLDVELLRHWANMQRALDGKSPFYVPNTGQREGLALEQVYLEDARHGCVVLARIWQVEPKAGREIPAGSRKALVHAAHKATARTLNDHKIGPHNFEGYTGEDIVGIEALFHYLDAKVCLMADIGEPCAEYISLRENVGWVYGVKDAPWEPKPSDPV